MLQIRPTCENCNKSLPNNSSEAMICTFECTFCKECVENVLSNVCPNCGGGFEKRPVRPSAFLGKFPVSEKIIFKAVNREYFKILSEKYKDIEPQNR